MTVSTDIMAVILAGGKGERMGRVDKGALQVGNIRLIDSCISALQPQSSQIFISGPSSYGLKIKNIPDVREAPGGPIGGLYSVRRYFRDQSIEIKGFLTIPVDCPDIPRDLSERLVSEGGSAIAVDDVGSHPTFAWWSMTDLDRVFTGKSERPKGLKHLARSVEARDVRWPGRTHFINFNRPDDIKSFDTPKH